VLEVLERPSWTTLLFTWLLLLPNRDWSRLQTLVVRETYCVNITLTGNMQWWKWVELNHRQCTLNIIVKTFNYCLWACWQLYIFLLNKRGSGLFFENEIMYQELHLFIFGWQLSDCFQQHLHSVLYISLK